MRASGRLAGARPLVAVPTYRLDPGRVRGWADGGVAVPEAYIIALRRAGLRPVMLAPGESGDPAEMLEAFDGLVLIGGGDVDPARYGASLHPEVYGVDPARDELEISLARQAVQDGLPLLAICRGLQVLDVALGGTLVPHLPDLPGQAEHGRPSGGGEQTVHDVLVERGSRLAGIVGNGPLAGCVSIHHQAVERVADCLVVTARSHDGVIEAMETPAGRGWVLAVQWHPERTAMSDPGQQAIFDGFGAAVRGVRRADQEKAVGAGG